MWAPGLILTIKSLRWVFYCFFIFRLVLVSDRVRPGIHTLFSSPSSRTRRSRIDMGGGIEGEEGVAVDAGVGEGTGAGAGTG